MKRYLRLFGLAAIATFALVIGHLALAQAGVPTGYVDDNYPNMVRSDGGGPYIDGFDCVSVIAGAAGGGFCQIRTVSNSDQCNNQTWGQRRFLTLNFGAPIEWDLDRVQDDPNSGLEEVPARFIASKAFARRAVTTPVSIHVLKINDDGTTTQDTAWQLQYKNEALVTIYPDGSRGISLAPGYADADLYEIVQVVKKDRVTTKAEYKATYDMPFSVRVSAN